MSNTTSPSPDPAIRLNPDQHCYVIPAGDGYSCLGYNNARDHANQIARAMKRPELAFCADDYATAAGYDKYCAAIAAWGRSRYGQRTYFDPDTDPSVRKILEHYRRSGETVRLILGNPQTGMCWLSEHDVVGTIGRSTGWLKVPLLVQPGDSGGHAILTANVLNIVDWNSGVSVYRHAAYLAPELLIRPTGEEGMSWRVQHQGVDVARFDDIGKAGAYVAFMRGLSIEPRAFQ
ncbi:hypothetical protein [Xanthomonas hortorum]|uniref:Uncharacterized protein n=1 Tax=Xanthomonas hortorum pv. hederae TaxID=453603 RepID=A0A9X4BSI5_9XANT|nr:hypothetical protein [Xanthomonas hortorum]MCE4369714.1 hypothetical protein [Xanthomonas hortorum pv. hederae]MDC8638729.1 hypothetical protein [Xanthomonas hortorum pv. hederae]PPU86250.1 hypothetical protein XhhCFBP4925_00535 [Xanthomonas hortorum pv. hederae]PUF01377.1 hypothetical protein C7T87_03405 [Xanthomonas hortorum pv. hederae]